MNRGGGCMEPEVRVRLPNFFIVGAQRAGTTSLYRYLGEHPEIYMSPMKEPCHFCSDIQLSGLRREYRRILSLDIERYLAGPMTQRAHIAFVRQWDQYVRLFRGAGNAKAVGEASVLYLYSSVAAARIRERIADPRVIILLRNPAERAFSHYLMNLGIGLTRRSFLGALEEDSRIEDRRWGVAHLYIEFGLYYMQVKRYLDTLGRGRVAILLLDDLRNDAPGVLASICRFLGVGTDHQPDTSIVYNRAAIPAFAGLNRFLNRTGIKGMARELVGEQAKERIKRLLLSRKGKPELTAAERRHVMGFYREDILRLSELMGRDLSAWLSD